MSEISLRPVKTQLLIFAKSPCLGRVKTRLQAVMGPWRARRLHREMVHAVIQMAMQSHLLPVKLLATESHRWLRALAARWGLDYGLQGKGNLGQRMAAASREALQHYEAVILLGGDCPLVTASDLSQLMEILAVDCPAAMIPANDGGYVALGLRCWSPALFSDIDWGSARVADQTRLRMTQLGWRWKELPPRADIDRPEDLQLLPGGVDFRHRQWSVRHR